MALIAVRGFRRNLGTGKSLPFVRPEMSAKNQPLDGARLAFENALRIFNVASEMRAGDLVGLSAALLVLSSEEFAKAITLADIASGSGSQQGVSKYFHKHKVKQAAAAQMSSVLHAVGILNGVHKDGCQILEAFEQWESSADQLKKRGLYVDYEGQRWLSPRDVSISDREISLFICQTLLALAKEALGKASAAKPLI